MPGPEFDLVVIGGGSAGLVAAAAAAALGAKVALVDRHRLGGDCLWTGCVPSKSLVASARVAYEMRMAEHWGLTPSATRPDLARVMARVGDVIAAIAPRDSAERFRALGVEVIFGSGRFVARDAFELDRRLLRGKYFVLATGSRPRIPAVPGIDDVPLLTSETVFDLRENVASLAVIGAGPMGCEFAQAFARLGSSVSVTDSAGRILMREDADIAEVVQAQLQSEGVAFGFNTAMTRVRVHAGEILLSVRKNGGGETTTAATHLLVCTGRLPNTSGLGLEAAGVSLAAERLVLDHRLRTTNPRIFACGDVAGGYQFTHLASHQAEIVLRQTLFKLFWTRPSRELPWCTFTDPELARVGCSEQQAKTTRIAHRVYRFPVRELDRASADGLTRGWAKIVTDPKGRILGASLVGPRAGELIHEWVGALNRRSRLSALAGMIRVYPTYSEITKRLGEQALAEKLTPRSRRWIRRLFRLQGSA